MNYETTRTYPRSLNEAFADVRATCVYLPPKRMGYVWVNWTAAVAVIVVVFCVLFQGAP